uniref:Uncharacterized protein n=1 Tax=Ignisphaera aggregans TaxID=334771 RepID=A0A7C5XN52_9CREN
MYIKEKSPLCSSCKRRYATFRRRTSGERLCRLCLYNSVIKQVRKAIHYYKMIRKNSSILFLIMVNKPLLSIMSLSIYESAVKNFNINNSVLLCFNKYLNCGNIKEIIKSGHYEFIEFEPHFITNDFIEWLKYAEFIAIKIAKESEIEFIVVPLYRDELVIISLLGMLSTSRTIFSEGLPIRNVGDIKITRPFYYVVSDDVLYLTLTSKFMSGIDLNEYKFEERYRFFKHIRNILGNSPELMYSSDKSAELLQSYLMGYSKRCKYCGSYNIDDICEYCKKFKEYIHDMYI